MKVSVVIAVVALTLVTISSLIVRTAAFRRFVLAKVVQRTEELTGARVQIGNFEFRWRGLFVDFYEVVLRGTEPESGRPLFAADHLAVGIKILSAWKRQIDLNEIILDRPVANLQVDSQGRNNLPTLASTGGAKSSSNLFDLAIQHVNIRSGEIYYNDRELRLSADLHNFHAESSFTGLTQQYQLSASYAKGILTYKDLTPIAHSVTLNLTVSRSGVYLDQMVASTDKSRILVRGELSDYANPSLKGIYTVQIDTADMAGIFRSRYQSAGQVQLRGNVNYRAAADTPFIKGISIDGLLDSASLSVYSPSARGELKSIHAKYQLANGNLFVSDAQTETLGGRVLANYQTVHLDSIPASRIDVSAEGISIRALAQAFLVREMPGIALTAKANVKAQASWTESVQRGSGRVNALIHSDDNVGKYSLGATLEGKINVTYQGASSTISVENSYLRSSATKVSLSGTLSNHSDLDVEINAADLHEVGTLARSLQPVNANSVSALDTTNIGGAARFRGHLSGPIHNPRLSGQLSASSLDLNNSHWRSLQSGVDLTRSGVALLNVSLQDEQLGELTGNARVGLTAWSFKDDSPINLQIAAKKLSLPEIQLLATQRYPITGTLAGTVSVTGSKENPSGHGSLSLAQGTAWNEPIKNLTITFNGDGSSIHSDVQVQIPAGAAAANLTYAPKTSQYVVQVNSAGLKLGLLNSIQARRTGVAGMLKLSVKGQGTMHNPALDATVDIMNLKVRDQSIPEVHAQLGVANQHATAAITAHLEQTNMDAKGEMDLTGERFANAYVNTGPIPIGFLLASYLPNLGTDLTGQTELHATLSGPLRDPARMQAHLEIPTLSLGYKAQQITNARPLRMSYASGLIKIEDAEMKGNGTDVGLGGSIPINSAASMDLNLNGSLDLSILRGFQPDLESSGRLDIQLAARGPTSSPQVQGQAKIVNAAVASGNIPIGFENVNGSFALSGKRLDIGNFSGNAGGGNVSATGFVTSGGNSNFSFNVNANNVRVRYPDGVRSVVGGSLQMNGSPASSTLSGKILIDRLSFTKDFDLANFIAQFSGETPPGTPSSLQQNMKLNIAVQTASNLNAVSSKVSVEGAANLTVGGSAADPVILGRTTLTGGEIFFLGKRYEVRNGTIEFANPARTEPTLNLYVTTTVQQYNITLNFVGPIDRLRTNYTSDPSLAPSDIINLIAFGKTAEQSASAASTPTSVGAESVLAQGVSGQVSGRLEKLAGISQLSIDPLAGSNPNDPGSQVSIQQRVSGNLLLTFSTDVTSTQNQAIQLEYQAKRNVSVSVLRDQNGGYAIDVRVRKVF